MNARRELEVVIWDCAQDEMRAVPHSWAFDPRPTAARLIADGWVKRPTRVAVICAFESYFGVLVDEDDWCDETVKLGDLGHLADTLLKLTTDGVKP